jgi:hypothetical protein
MHVVSIANPLSNQSYVCIPETEVLVLLKPAKAVKQIERSIRRAQVKKSAGSATIYAYFGEASVNILALDRGKSERKGFEPNPIREFPNFSVDTRRVTWEAQAWVSQPANSI